MQNYMNLRLTFGGNNKPTGNVPQVDSPKGFEVLPNARRIIVQKTKEKPVHWLGESISLLPVDNWGVVGQTQSGKSEVVGNLVDEFSGPQTEIYLFQPNHDIDKTYKRLTKQWEKKKLKVHKYKSIYHEKNTRGKGGRTVIGDFLEKKRGEAEGKNEKKKNWDGNDKEHMKLLRNEPNDIEKFFKKQEKKIMERENPDEVENEDYDHLPKTKDGRYYQKYLFIFDDLAAELTDPAIGLFLRECRQHGIRSIISSQAFVDLGKGPGARNQFHNIVMMRNLPKETIDTIHSNTSVSVPINNFHKMYSDLTSGDFFYPFIYMCPIKRDYRQYFHNKLDFDMLMLPYEEFNKVFPQVVERLKGKEDGASSSSDSDSD